MLYTYAYYIYSSQYLFLQDEYWAVEARTMEEYYTKENIEEISLEKEEGFEEMQAFADLIEVWSSVTLYIDAGYDLVSSLPDAQLRYVCFYCSSSLKRRIHK